MFWAEESEEQDAQRVERGCGVHIAVYSVHELKMSWEHGVSQLFVVGRYSSEVQDATWNVFTWK